MYYELRQCVQENKSLIYAPFIQALIETVCPAKYITSFKTLSNMFKMCQSIQRR